MYIARSMNSLKYRHMFRPEEEIDSGVYDLIMDGDTIGIEYDDDDEDEDEDNN